VGRPNVGKSTLFNRLTHSRRSIVGDEPGITRDRIYGDIEWDGRIVRLVDTGGIVPDDAEYIPSEIYAQARVGPRRSRPAADGRRRRTELASPDFTLAKMLIRGGKPVFLVDQQSREPDRRRVAENFRQLGLRGGFPWSAPSTAWASAICSTPSSTACLLPRSGRSKRRHRFTTRRARPNEPDLEDEVVFDEDQEDEISEDMGPENDEDDRNGRDAPSRLREFGPKKISISEAGRRSEIVNANGVRNSTTGSSDTPAPHPWRV
jgi:hypothetical protein